MGTSTADMIRAGLVYENGAWQKAPPSLMPKELEKPKPRIRQDHAPLMNKLESEFYNYIYEQLYGVFGTPVLLVQSLRFKLGNGIWYKPDVVFLRPQVKWTCYEVKGPKAWRGGYENLKVAAHQYPMIQWVLAWKNPACGEWATQIVLP